MVAVGLISVVDWARGPDRRSHLGNFVQRILDGDAIDVVARKAVASGRDDRATRTEWSPFSSGSPSGCSRSGSWCRPAGDEFSTLGP